jgi:amidophosphoribosyltransferase
MYGCKYLNFSRSTSEMDLITRRVILEREGEITEDLLKEYTNPDSEKYQAMVEDIRQKLGFTSLQYARLDDIVESIGLSPCKLCTYCWSGKE